MTVGSVVIMKFETLAEVVSRQAMPQGSKDSNKKFLGPKDH